VFDWLFDGCLPISLVLGAAGLGLAWAWYRTNQSSFAYGFFILLIMLVIYVTLCFFVETTSEQIERKIRLMVAGVDQKNVDKIFEHISDRFEYQQGSTRLNKQEMRGYAAEGLRRPELRGILVTGIGVDNIDRGAGTAKALFQVKVLGTNEVGDTFFQVDADFVRDSDKEWRMQSFRLFRPIGEHNDPISLPIR
jgi:hypothetical protein